MKREFPGAPIDACHRVRRSRDSDDGCGHLPPSRSGWRRIEASGDRFEYTRGRLDDGQRIRGAANGFKIPSDTRARLARRDVLVDATTIDGIEFVIEILAEPLQTISTCRVHELLRSRRPAARSPRSRIRALCS